MIKIKTLALNRPFVPPQKMTLEHDGEVHNPLGGASYVFKDHYVDYIANDFSKPEIAISIGAQPNSSPHFGTLVVFNLAFALGQELKRAKNVTTPKILFEMVDTAPSKTINRGGIDYQTSLRDSHAADTYLPQYIELMDILRAISKIRYDTRKQCEFNAQPEVPSVLKLIIENREILGKILDPSKGLLRIRVACPACGLTDKNGIDNVYFEDHMQSKCPDHGAFETYFDEESHKFEYNTPLRNLIRAIIYGKQNKDETLPFGVLRVTGSDYAGYYQERFLYKAASMLGIPPIDLPTIIYSPLITDWSGAKLSKSLYVKKNAYGYLPSYLVDYAKFYEKFGEKGIETLFNEVKSWLEEPYKLFRNYSVYYFMNLFKNE